MGQPGGALRGGARGLLSGLAALLSRCWAPLPHRDLGFHRPAWDRGAETLALDVLADHSSLPLRRASYAGKRVDTQGGAPCGRTDLVRALSGVPRVDAVRLPTSWHVGGVLKRSPVALRSL